MISKRLALLVCDGVSTNLTAIKATHGYFGAYPINKGPLLDCSVDQQVQDPYEVSPWFINPFNPRIG